MPLLRGHLPAGVASRRRTRDALSFYAFVSPWLLGTLLLTAFPLGYACYLSFTAWNGLTPNQPWVGWDNYREVLSSPDTVQTLAKTLLLVAVVVPVTVVGSLVLAVLLDKRIRGRVVLRSLIYLPAIVPPVAAALIWKVVFDKNSGAANRLLALFGGNAVGWLTGNTAFVVLIVVLLWGLGTGIIINLAALQNVPAEQLEAARIDGAGTFTTFRHVTLPAISPVLLFQTVLAGITTLQTFVPAILLSPISNSNVVTNIPNANRVYMVDVYEQFFAYSRYGYGSAMLMVFFVVIIAVTGVMFRTLGRSVFYAVDPAESGRKG
ncbi:sugar ABC transporter permease [Streptomyces sp. NPDC051642]|uniref:carbohydrate ABC transporter permease n=1 Tax=unclassified Streptomyces TaxID=2593676 RepID=UPI0034398D29